ncbi:MAG TPA: hypothetical protein VN672_00610 [Solirubrobacteraceae bacterium]|nr:hypothetical protein [Solirubrobacteraceae bacterium]
MKLALDDFELWRRRLMTLMFVAVGLLVAYWAAWVGDRRLVASDHTSEYVAFEQAFPLADAWLLGAMLLAVLQLWRRRPSALTWLLVTGGAGIYLCALDVLFDLQHGIYAKPDGGAVELAVNLLTLALGVGLLRFTRRFRSQLLGTSPELPRAAGETSVPRKA